MMSGIDDMALTGSSSSSRKTSAEIPLTVSSLIDKSDDFLTSETITISTSRSSSISSHVMGMGNDGSKLTGSAFINSTATPNQRQHQHPRHQSISTDSPGKSNNKMSSLTHVNNENGKVLGEKVNNGKQEETSISSGTISGSEDTCLNNEMESENSMSDTYYTPSASIYNLSSQLISTTSGIGSDSEMNLSINSGDSNLDDAEAENYRNFEIGPLSSDLNVSKISLDVVNNEGSIVNSMSLESGASMDSSKESSSSSTHSNSKEALQPGVYNTKMPTKKKMWYHVFQPSYKTRSTDFKKYFKDLPSEERLIVDYSCALQRDILVQGRMYVSQSYISFYANIFGWETQTCIRLKDVTSITKEKTALVIPNAVQVCTENERFFFASFVGRDSTFMMLFKLWQTSLLQEQSMPLKQVWQLVHSCYGEIGSEEEDDDYHTDAPENQIPSILLSTTGNANIEDKSIEIDQVVENGISQVADHVVSSSRSSTLKAAIEVNGHSSGVGDTDSSDSEGEILHVPVEDLYLEVPLCPVPHNQGTEVVNSIIPCDVDQLFTMLFTKSKFYLDFHLKRKTFNIVQGDWEQNLGETKKVRQVSFTVTLNNAMGPKHSHLTETQILLPESKPGCLYIIDAESVNAGIPYEDSFYVTCHFCLSRISALESKLIIICQVKYKKSVSWIIKPFIEKNSWAGLKEFYSHLEQALKEECAKITVLSHSPVPSARISGPVVRRRKRMAPAPPCATSDGKGTDNESIPISGSVPLSGEDKNGSLQISTNSSFIFKVTLAILTTLLLLNAYLFIKLIRLETVANSPVFQPTPAFMKELPQNHQDWLLLLQHQEALHRVELQKWHEVLVAALQILHQAETDLKLLTLRISSYSEGRVDISELKLQPGSTEIPLAPLEQNLDPGYRESRHKFHVDS